MTSVYYTDQRGTNPIYGPDAVGVISPGVGSIVITGYAPTVTQVNASPNLVPGSGTITITGYAPTVAQSVNQSAVVPSWVGPASDLFPQYRGESYPVSPLQGQANWAKALTEFPPQPSLV